MPPDHAGDRPTSGGPGRFPATNQRVHAVLVTRLAERPAAAQWLGVRLLVGCSGAAEPDSPVRQVVVEPARGLPVVGDALELLQPVRVVD